MFLRGEPYLPPGCPVLKGQAPDGVSLAGTTAYFRAHDCQRQEDGSLKTTEAYIAFYRGNDTDGEQVAESAALALPFSDTTSGKAVELAERVEKGDTAVAERFGALLGERVMNCPGMLGGGCSLGAAVVRAVTDQVFEELNGSE